MKKRKNPKSLDELISRTISGKVLEFDCDTWKQQHPDETLQFEAKTQRRRTHNCPAIDRGRIIMKNRITKLAAAAVILVAVFIVLKIFGINSSSVAWADISEHFESVPFFNLTTYIGKDDSSEIRKIQIWKSEDSRARVLYKNGTTFVGLKDGKMKLTTFDRHSELKLKAVNISVRHSANDPNVSLTKILIDTLCAEGQFSLDTLIKSFPSNVSGITPVEAADTAASKEIIVFEAKSQTTSQYLTLALVLHHW